MRSSLIAIAGAALLALVLVISSSAQSSVVDTVGSFAEISVKALLRPLWPFGRGKRFNLDRLDPTCPQCL